jgi:RND family efflux transporter MFP subunit
LKPNLEGIGRTVRWLPIVALAVLGTGCVNREAQQQAKKTQEILSDPSTLVEVQELKPETLLDEFEISGQMVAQMDAQVGAKIGARLVAVYVKDGDRVGAGQAIARQDGADINAQVRQAQSALSVARNQLTQSIAEKRQGPVRSQASVQASEARLQQARANLEKLRKGARDEEREQVKAQVAAARSNMETVKRDLARDEELFKQGAISQADVDRTRNQYQAALSQYEQSLENWRMMQNGSRSEDIAAAEQRVREAEEALKSDRAQKNLDVQYSLREDSAREQVIAAEEQLRIARNNQSESVIRSPFSGTIAGRPLQPGTYVAPGTPVARVVGSGGIYFEGEVPENKIGKLGEGSVVRVTTSGTGTADIMGKVLAVNPLGSETGRIFRVRVGLQDPPPTVRAGMFARGRIELERIEGATVVPTPAVLKEGNNNYVFIMDGTKAKKRTIKVLREQKGRSQIDGLPLGTKVIVRGQEKLAEGALVKLEGKG